jgi:hypothetical protein
MIFVDRMLWKNPASGRSAIAALLCRSPVTRQVAALPSATIVRHKAQPSEPSATPKPCSYDGVKGI